MSVDYKKEARNKIERLVKKYEGVSETRLKTINEADTRRMFIMPLFEALGWDVDNEHVDNEVVEEETSIVGGRIDYSFRLNNITQFILEAKAIPEDLNKEKWAMQAIEYGWNKGITWVVLSDFEGLKLFNSEWKIDHPKANLNLTYKEYLKEFDNLWLLSKQSFEQKELQKQASKWGITSTRESVNEKLAQDLLNWREKLTNNLLQWNTDKSEEVINESVQRILDRLIFIRVVEDREFEEKKLWQIFKKWESERRESNNFIKVLKPLFKKFDGKYNSNLFSPHVCEELNTEGDPFSKIIPQLYGEKERGVKYRFDAIDVDVLGSVYEQYLGYVQGIDGTKSKRKKQGIYYTPSYIVEYIVRNTLGNILSDQPERIGDIKIIDPACGSGSFLTKAFAVINEYSKKKDKDESKNGEMSTKYKILKNSIFGVDLDPQATEIARLNMLIKALEPGHKLPMLTDNVKVGNSLVSGSEKDLKKIFGEDWRDQKPFNWEREFSDVFDKGGFDIVIGNPPYVGWAKGKQSSELKEYFHQKYNEIYSGKNDLLYYFILKGIKLLRQGGVMSFIVSRYFLESVYAKKLREYLLDNVEILSIIDFRKKQVFEGASVHTAIITLRNKKPEKNIITIYLDDIYTKPFYIKQVKLKQMDIWSLEKPTASKLIAKFENEGEPITKHFDIKNTPLTALDEIYIIDKKTVENFNLEKKYLRKFIRSTNIQRKYLSSETNKYMIHIDKHSDLSKTPNLKKYLKTNRTMILERNKRRNEKLGLGLARPMIEYPWGEGKLFCRSRAKDNIFIYDNKGMVGSRHNTTVLFAKSDVDIKYFLGLLNSRLFGFYIRSKSKKMGESYEYLPKYLNSLVVKIGKKKKLVDLVNKVIVLEKQLDNLSDLTDNREVLKKRVEDIDEKINEEVYDMYGLNSEEIKIVEGVTTEII
ncbi:N-6 DNA methylase [Patescibacteria group bacterium]|nr:N-6 DNA methylase [Patescibacteria group bacterium]MBU0776981.1 N-6 DNA methylase [Patescibacteria group bacterium]MBU0845587.1 N-6 DNA methylase [Patescibacteria group bacterium]MBU0923010.1 N-6 DNA methylase [Patescibacteria group bacterium]MBU1066334.1 N-6 DNA methylase [Patescibacteria group bacterium]